MVKFRHKRDRQYPAIPQPEPNVQALQVTSQHLKEAVEMLQGQTGSAYDCAVTWGDLMKLGLIREDQVPLDVGKDRLR